MARIIDENRIEQVKEATIRLIVEKGYGGASISTIAKNANVAEGYLYRHYSSKKALVDDLLYSKVNILIEGIKNAIANNYSIKDSICFLIDSIVQLAENKQEDIMFLYVLMHDYNFQIDEEQMQTIRSLAFELHKQGIKTKQIKADITVEELFNMLISYPIVYLNQRIKGFFGLKAWNKEDIARLKTFCIESIVIS